jgi:Flp pilus assembly protein TadD
MTLSAMRGARRGLVLAATGIILAAGPARAQDADEPMPEAQHSRLPPGAVVQSLDTGPGAELRSNLRALAENPRSLDALIGAGRAAIGLRDGEAATGFFTRAQEIAPGDPRVMAGMASAALLSERPEQALILFAEAAQRGAPEGEIAGDRGLAYDMVGDPRHAQQDYALALRHRNDPEIERRLALSLAISGQRDAALRVIDAQLRRHDRAAWRTEAFVLALTGDPAGADDTARRLMPAPNAQAMAPFFARLAYLSPAQKAAAVNFGRFPSDGRAGQAANVDTRADPGALAMAQGGPRIRFQPPLAAPVNGTRRRADPGEQRADSLIRRRPDTVAPAVQPSRRVEVAQAQQGRFGTNPPPDPDDEEQPEGGAPEPSAPNQRAPVVRPREAPAFVAGGNFTLDSSHEEAPSQPQAPAAAPGFGSIGPTQAPSVRRFQSITAEPRAMSDIASMVRSLPDESGSPTQPSAPALTLAERQARDAAAREAEARYRGASPSARTGSAAGGRHWVQIAHTDRMSALAGQYRQVRARAPALLDGQGAWTVADRSTNRLLIGPFDSAGAARDYIDQLGARRIAAVPWESAGQSVERLQEGGSPSAGRARAAEADRAPASTARSGRYRHADERSTSSGDRGSDSRSARDPNASDDRGSAHGRSARDRQTADDSPGSHSRSARDRSTADDRSGSHSRSARDRSTADDRSGSHSRSARDRSTADDRSSSHGRTGRAGADDRNARSRSGRDRDTADDRSNAHGRQAAHRGSADDERPTAHARTAHGRAADDSPHNSRNRSSQERRQAANDTRPARGRSSEEQRPAPHGRRSH